LVAIGDGTRFGDEKRAVAVDDENDRRRERVSPESRDGSAV
jgi:hypothetical protein